MRVKNWRGWALAALCGIVGVMPLAIEAEESEVDMDSENSQRCVNMARIRNVDIIDRQTLLFEMSGDKVYLNQLPNPCPGLNRDSVLLYRMQMNRLCRLDLITVLESFGRGFMPGATCGLGNFSRLSEQQVEALKHPKE